MCSSDLDHEANSQEMAKLQAALEKSMQSPAERAALDAVKAKAQALQGSIDKAQTLKGSGDTAAVVNHVQSATQAELKAFLSAQQALVSLTEEGATALRDKAGQERMRTVWSVAGIMAVIVVLISIGTRILQRNVCDPLDEIVRVAQAIGQGDLSVAIDAERKDEMGDVLRSLRGMAYSLAQLVGQVHRSTGSISIASSEIAHGNQDLSNRTETTAANLQRAASTMDHLNSTLQQSAASARQANALAGSAFSVAESGGSAVSQVVSTMHEINSSSRKIVDIIGVIDGIAFQTNILALNAAVEAARAGEIGRAHV